MKKIALAFMLASFAIGFADASFGYPPPRMAPLPGTPPDMTVKHWVRLLVLGEVNAPLPVVWVSPQVFSLSGFQRLIVLPRARYDAFLSRTRSSRCSASLAPLEKEQEWRAVLATEYSYGHQHDCILSREKACRFFSDVVVHSNAGWTKKNLASIQLLKDVVQCAELPAKSRNGAK